MQKTILKTTDPASIKNCEIVSQPSGNNPYFLVKVCEVPTGLEADVIEDTAVFFADYDLSEGEDSENEQTLTP